jgi:hypothetical protein
MSIVQNCPTENQTFTNPIELITQGIGCNYTINGATLNIYDLQNIILSQIGLDFNYTIESLLLKDSSVIFLVNKLNVAYLYHVELTNPSQVEMVFNKKFINCNAIFKTKNGYGLVSNSEIFVLNLEFEIMFHHKFNNPFENYRITYDDRFDTFVVISRNEQMDLLNISHYSCETGALELSEVYMIA